MKLVALGQAVANARDWLAPSGEGEGQGDHAGAAGEGLGRGRRRAAAMNRSTA